MSTTTPRRHWSFNLRALMLAVVAISALLAWKVNQVCQQRALVAAVEERGWVYFDNDVDAEGWEESGPAVSAAPSWLAQLLGEDFFSHVTGVGLIDDPQDADFDRLEQFPHLRTLCIQGPGLTERRCAAIARAKSLRRLAIYADLTDDGAAQFRLLPDLRTVLLENPTSLADRGFRYFIEIKSMKNFQAKADPKKISRETVARLYMELNPSEVNIWD